MASAKAQIAKDKGNNAFKTGNWAEAVGYYSEAVITDRSNPTFPLNRAAAYLKLNKYQDAERDCTTVLSIEPKNVKAFFRRAQARSALERYADAEKDLSDALRIEPSNDSIKSELSSVQIKKAESEQSLISKSSERNPATLTSTISTNQPSTIKPTRRRVRDVPIEIVEPETDTIEINGAASLEKTQPSHTDFLTPVQSRKLSPSPKPAVASNSTAVSHPVSARPTPRVGAGVFRADGNYKILRSPDSASLSQSASASKHSVPQTHFAFTRAWNNSKTTRERFELIQLIPPESLPTLFRNNLETELLASILQTFLDITSVPSDYNSLILTYMSNIPATPRFDTIVLFFSQREKDIAKSLWNNIDPNRTSDYRNLWKV